MEINLSENERTSCDSVELIHWEDDWMILSLIHTEDYLITEMIFAQTHSGNREMLNDSGCVYSFR